MSPAATRRYIVGFARRLAFEIVVLANSKREAIAKAKAIYGLDGLGEFTLTNDREPWHAECLDKEARS